MSLAEIRELYLVALTWTNGDEERAATLVELYLRGDLAGVERAA